MTHSLYAANVFCYRGFVFLLNSMGRIGSEVRQECYCVVEKRPQTMKEMTKADVLRLQPTEEVSGVWGWDVVGFKSVKNCQKKNILYRQHFPYLCQKNLIGMSCQ